MKKVLVVAALALALAAGLAGAQDYQEDWQKGIAALASLTKDSRFVALEQKEARDIFWDVMHAHLSWLKRFSIDLRRCVADTIWGSLAAKKAPSKDVITVLEACIPLREKYGPQAATK